MADGGDRPIFVVGCARSGTTLLQLMLHAHPRIAVPPETRFLIEAYDRRDEFGDLRDRDNRTDLAEFITRRRKRIRDLGLDRDRLVQRLVDARPTVGTMCGEVFRAYADRFGKPRWGAKRPAYVERIPAIMRMFPDAQIVHIIRDGRDCVASLKEMPWWEHGTVGAVHKWIEAMRLGARAQGRLGDDHYHELRYEDLVAHPELVLRRLCGFLDEDFHEAMLAPHEMADEGVPDRKHWHERTHQPVNEAAVERWRDGLSDDELQLFESVAWRWMDHHGYRPAHERRPLPPARLYPDYLGYGLRRRTAAGKTELRDLLRRRAETARDVSDDPVQGG